MLKASGRQVDPNGLVSLSLPELAAAAIELFGDSTFAFVRSVSVQEATRPPARARETDRVASCLNPSPAFKPLSVTGDADIITTTKSIDLDAHSSGEPGASYCEITLNPKLATIKWLIHSWKSCICQFLSKSMKTACT